MIELTPVYGKSIKAANRLAAMDSLANEGWRAAEAAHPFPSMTWMERDRERAVLMETDGRFLLIVVDQRLSISSAASASEASSET